MPEFLKTNPVGIDEPIQALQKAFFRELVTDWGIASARYNCYGRAYRNQSGERGFIAEVYNGKDYDEVYFNDNVSAVSFFGVSNESQVSQDGMMTGYIHILFFVNLAEIKPGAQRNDDEARIDVQRVISRYGVSRGFLITKQTTGIDKILQEYPGTRLSEGLRFRDQHPLHCFRFDCQVFYQPTLIKC